MAGRNYSNTYVRVKDRASGKVDRKATADLQFNNTLSQAAENVADRKSVAGAKRMLKGSREHPYKDPRNNSATNAGIKSSITKRTRKPK